MEVVGNANGQSQLRRRPSHVPFRHSDLDRIEEHDDESKKPDTGADRQETAGAGGISGAMEKTIASKARASPRKCQGIFEGGLTNSAHCDIL